MREDILSQKIGRELTLLPIDTEPRVMYLLVEIRKVLDHENDRDNLLHFYGDWSVHTTMDRAWAKKVLDQVADENSSVASHIMAFYKLRSELKSFLKRHGLPTDIVEKESHWMLFREKLLDILIDTPIERPDTAVASFRFQRRGSSGIEFLLVYRDGRESYGRIMEP